MLPYKCEICKLRFVIKSKLEHHQRIHALMEPVKREESDPSPIPKRKRNAPQNRGTFKNPESYLCSKCGLGFEVKKMLERHERVHSNRKFYKCDRCQQGFFWKSNYNRHCKGPCLKTEYRCRKCHRTFAKKLNLARHQACHTKIQKSPEKAVGVVPDEQEVSSSTSILMDESGPSTSKERELDVKVFVEQTHSTPSGGQEDNASPETVQPDAENDKSTEECSPDPTFEPYQEWNEIRYICETCGSGFRFKCDLCRHWRTHDDVKPFLCDQCNLGFNWKSNLVRHQRRIHIGKRSFQCEMCGLEFVKKLHLTRHLKYCNKPEGEGYCTDYNLRARPNSTTPVENDDCNCDKIPKHSEDVIVVKLEPEDFSETSSNEQKIDCIKETSKVTQEVNIIYLHACYDEMKPQQSEECNPERSSISTQIKEEAARENVVGKSTEAMPKGAASENDSATSTEAMPKGAVSENDSAKSTEATPGEKIENGVDVSNEAIGTRNTTREKNADAILKTPSKKRRIKTSDNKFLCSICGRVFTRKTCHMQHERSHKQPLECKWCRRTFSRNSVLSKHERTHTGETPFRCVGCLSYFRQKSQLVQHQNIHTGVKSHECDVCKRRFNRKSTLVRHKMIHTGERPFECDVCHLCFNQKSILVQHFRIHNGLKPYKCMKCNYSFTQKWNYRRHNERVHNGGKKFSIKCSSCDCSFPRKRILVQHEKIHGKKTIVLRIYNTRSAKKRNTKKNQPLLNTTHSRKRIKTNSGQKPDVLGHHKNSEKRKKNNHADNLQNKGSVDQNAHDAREFSVCQDKCVPVKVFIHEDLCGSKMPAVQHRDDNVKLQDKCINKTEAEHAVVSRERNESFESLSDKKSDCADTDSVSREDSPSNESRDIQLKNSLDESQEHHEESHAEGHNEMKAETHFDNLESDKEKCGIGKSEIAKKIPVEMHHGSENANDKSKILGHPQKIVENENKPSEESHSKQDVNNSGPEGCMETDKTEENGEVKKEICSDTKLEIIEEAETTSTSNCLPKCRTEKNYVEKKEIETDESKISFPEENSNFNGGSIDSPPEHYYDANNRSEIHGREIQDDKNLIYRKEIENGSLNACKDESSHQHDGKYVDENSEEASGYASNNESAFISSTCSEFENEHSTHLELHDTETQRNQNERESELQPTKFPELDNKCGEENRSGEGNESFEETDLDRNETRFDDTQIKKEDIEEITHEIPINIGIVTGLGDRNHLGNHDKISTSTSEECWDLKPTDQNFNQPLDIIPDQKDPGYRTPHDRACLDFCSEIQYDEKLERPENSSCQVHSTTTTTKNNAICSVPVEKNELKRAYTRKDKNKRGNFESSEEVSESFFKEIPQIRKNMRVTKKPCGRKSYKSSRRSSRSQGGIKNTTARGKKNSLQCNLLADDEFRSQEKVIAALSLLKIQDGFRQNRNTDIFSKVTDEDEGNISSGQAENRCEKAPIIIGLCPVGVSKSGESTKATDGKILEIPHSTENQFEEPVVGNLNHDIQVENIKCEQLHSYPNQEIGNYDRNAEQMDMEVKEEDRIVKDDVISTQVFSTLNNATSEDYENGNYSDNDYELEEINAYHQNPSQSDCIPEEGRNLLEYISVNQENVPATCNETYQNRKSAQIQDPRESDPNEIYRAPRNSNLEAETHLLQVASQSDAPDAKITRNDYLLKEIVDNQEQVHGVRNETYFNENYELTNENSPNQEAAQESRSEESRMYIDDSLQNVHTETASYVGNYINQNPPRYHETDNPHKFSKEHNDPNHSFEKDEDCSATNNNGDYEASKKCTNSHQDFQETSSDQCYIQCKEIHSEVFSESLESKHDQNGIRLEEAIPSSNYPFQYKEHSPRSSPYYNNFSDESRIFHHAEDIHENAIMCKKIEGQDSHFNERMGNQQNPTFCYNVSNDFSLPSFETWQPSKVCSKDACNDDSFSSNRSLIFTNQDAYGPENNESSFETCNEIHSGPNIVRFEKLQTHHYENIQSQDIASTADSISDNNVYLIQHIPSYDSTFSGQHCIPNDANQSNRPVDSQCNFGGENTIVYTAVDYVQELITHDSNSGQNTFPFRAICAQDFTLLNKPQTHQGSNFDEVHTGPESVNLKEMFPDQSLSRYEEAHDDPNYADNRRNSTQSPQVCNDPNANCYDLYQTPSRREESYNYSVRPEKVRPFSVHQENIHKAQDIFRFEKSYAYPIPHTIIPVQTYQNLTRYGETLFSNDNFRINASTAQDPPQLSLQAPQEPPRLKMQPSQDLPRLIIQPQLNIPQDSPGFDMKPPQEPCRLTRQGLPRLNMQSPSHSNIEASPKPSRLIRPAPQYPANYQVPAQQRLSDSKRVPLFGNSSCAAQSLNEIGKIQTHKSQQDEDKRKRTSVEYNQSKRIRFDTGDVLMISASSSHSRPSEIVSEKLFGCDKCDQRFIRKEDRIRHRFTAHDKFRIARSCSSNSR